MADLKISQFIDGGDIQIGDEIATNRAGVNTKVKVRSGATLDAGLGFGDLLTVDEVGGVPALPAMDGSQLTGVVGAPADADYGDITVSGSAWTINAKAVTFAKMQDVSANIVVGAATAGSLTSISIAQNRILGRGSAGDIQALSVVAPLGFSASALTFSRNETVTTANTGTSYAINFNNGPNFNLTLTGNCTFTFTNPPANSGSFSVILRQDGTGGRSATWPASVDWPGGSAPSLSAGANAVDVLTFFTVDGGTNWNGFLAGKGMA